MSQRCPTRLTRRTFLASVAIAALAESTGPVLSRTFGGILPWKSNSSDPPPILDLNGWRFFTTTEARTVEAIVDRLVPADSLSIGGKEAGCAIFIDRQLAGSYGSSSRLYTKGPFPKGLPTQGYQGQATPAELFRSGVEALGVALKNQLGGKSFFELASGEQDQILKDLESGKLQLGDGVNGKAFFGMILNSTMEGFFADPIYGGNKDMASWRMLGFPGARYDYRDHVSKHNEPYPLPPVSIVGAPEWQGRQG